VLVFDEHPGPRFFSEHFHRQAKRWITPHREPSACSSSIAMGCLPLSNAWIMPNRNVHRLD
jgi:hypothetical protein